MKRFFVSILDGSSHPGFMRWMNPLLHAASWVYGRLVALIAFLYELGILKAQRLNVPVISVGNLTWGGTGKTPFVIELAQRVRALGKKALILTRGYGSDEWKELSVNLPECPIGVGKRRVEVGRSLLAAQHVDIVICDDAFQHRSLYRDWDIVLVNSRAPFGNGCLVPRGSLREPLRALGRAETVVITHTNRVEREPLEELKARLLSYAPDAAWVEAVHEPCHFYRASSHERREVDSFRGEPAAAVCAIGTPRLFHETLADLGVEVRRKFDFPDHYNFRPRDWRSIRTQVDKLGVRAVITTEKDFVRSAELWIRYLDPWILKIRVRVVNGDSVLTSHLRALLGLPILQEAAYV